MGRFVRNSIYNVMYKDGEEMDKTADAVTKKPEKAFFDKEGKIIFALKATRGEFEAQLE